MATSLLEAHSLSAVTPDGITVFSGLDIVLERRVVALVGRNGSGKSTLGRMLAGKREPDGGVVLRHARTGWLPQEIHPDPNARIIDLLGVADAWLALQRIQSGHFDPAYLEAVGDQWDLESRLATWLSRFGLAHLSLVSEARHCSGGERTRLGLIRLLLQDPELLILDEPSNHLDTAGRRQLIRFLETWQGGALVISHDRSLLSHVEHILELSSLGLAGYPGPWSTYRALKEQERAAAAHHYEVARAEHHEQTRRRQAALERQQRRLSQGHKKRRVANQAKLLLDFQAQGSEATEARLRRQHASRVAASGQREHEARAALEAVTPIALSIASAKAVSGRRVLVVSDVAMAFGERVLYRDLSFELLGAERLAVRGINGCGKSVLLRLAGGGLQPSTGHIAVCGPVKMLDQHQSLLNDGQTALDNYRRLAPGLTEAEYRTRLARLGITGDHVLRKVAVLSGGERLKVALAGMLLGPCSPQLLLLDEPTNHQDLESVTALEDALRGYDGALIVVSHDEHFLENVGVTHELRLDQPGARKTPRAPARV